jgi:hypothetical protein
MLNSLIAIDSETAYSWSVNTLEGINKYRTQQEDWWVKSETLKANNKWYRKLFKLKPLTGQDILDSEEYRLDNCPIRSELWWIRREFYYSEELCNFIIGSHNFTKTYYLTLTDYKRLVG